MADAVRADLQGVGGPRGLVAVAVKLAQAIDLMTSARYLPPLSRELRNVLQALDAAAGKQASGDVIDEIAAARERRRQTVEM